MKNKNGLYITLCAILMVLFVLPIIQQTYHPFKVKKLNGVIVETDKPKWNYNNYKDLSYQTQLERYVSENFGFREPIIRLYNQYLWLYRKTYSADIVIGKDKWLYGERSIYDHYRQVVYDYADSNEAFLKKINTNIERLKRVQDILDQRGTKLFVLVCPSKDLLYPDHLPEGGQFVMGDGIRAIEYVPNAFADNGINFLDLNAWFQQIKDTVDYPLFPKTGLHWSNIAAAHASDTIIQYMEWLTGKNMPNVKVGATRPGETVAPDNDLEKLLNLMWPIKPNQNYYAKVEAVPDSTAQKLRLVTIGDSFFWNLTQTMPMDELFESHPYWYYFNTVYFDPQYHNVKEISIIEELDRTDVVMILFTATHLYTISNNFLDRVLFCFTKPNPETLECILEDIMQKMDANSVWLQSLEEQAEQRGQTLDEVKRANALYVYRQNPEKFLSRILVETP